MNLLNLDVGSWKAIGERALNYFGKLITLINFILLINVSAILGADLLVYLPVFLLILTLGVLFMIFDILVILPQENKYLFRKNPEIQEIKSDIKEMRRLLDEK